jgi:hypothetical protein
MLIVASDDFDTDLPRGAVLSDRQGSAKNSLSALPSLLVPAFLREQRGYHDVQDRRPV